MLMETDKSHCLRFFVCYSLNEL